MNTTTTTSNRVENISATGRVIRFSVGAAMIAPLFFISGPIGGFAILALLAILPVLCGIDGFCPLTAWYERVSSVAHTRMSNIQRGSYAGVAIALIGSVFVVPVQPLGALAVLPLLGIYPAIVALFGAELFSEWLSSFRVQAADHEERYRANVHRVTQAQHHGHVAHAA